MSNWTRRSVLKSLGIASVGLTGTRLATAEENQNFDGRIQNLLTKRKVEEAKDLANSRGIELSISTSTVSPNTGDVSTDNFYVDPDSSTSDVWVSGYSPINGGDHRVIAGWDLYEDQNAVDAFNTCPNDAAGLFWDSDHYTPVSADSSNFYPSGWRVEYEGINTYQGALARLDDPLPPKDGSRNHWQASFGVELNDTGSGDPRPFVMEYRHTYIDSATKTCGAINVGISFGNGTIQLDGNTRGWQATGQLDL